MIARLLALFLGFLAMTVSSGEGANRGTPSEVAAALDADLDSERGAELYQSCAACHQTTGWGVLDGSVPQVAGRIYEVLLTQISDFTDRERIHPRMMPFVSNHYLAGPQILAHVAALPPATRSSTETGQDLERGAAALSGFLRFLPWPEGPGQRGDSCTATGWTARPVCSAPDPLDR